ncbi:hypothetical protein PVAND_014978 [Polypedilum vanderplanki]|uniref:Peptidase S1 domain-containing protein n=2 Tax=Polypedilum vanderplanki TaxID=319348 RepID=A0A9J6BBB7_POLVA|nr:hypothetical protein PVAND_014978 [Polypedilum vanderplanki]
MLLKILIFSIAVYQVSPLQGGTNVGVGTFPSFVAIFLPTPTTICGGVILNNNHVLTLTSCMLNLNYQLLPANQVSIMTGWNTLDFNRPRTQVQAIYVHPRYSPFTLDNDVAVIRSLTPFIFPEVANPAVAPVLISDRIAFDTMACNLAAWNRNNSQLQTINPSIPIINRDQCNELAVNFGRLSEGMLCAGSIVAGSGVCATNIGAALYCNGRIEGILNSGFGCGAANNPGVYVQARMYEQWIQEQIRRQDIPAANSFPLERLP